MKGENLNSPFETIVESLQEGSIINFKEYNLDRHERKKLNVSIENATVKEVFPANETLNREKLVEIYGEDLDDLDYLALAISNCPRYLLNLGLSEDNVMNVKMITLNQDFYNLGQQDIEIIGNMNEVEEPNYVFAQRGW